MSILFGLYTPDEGEILVNGEKANIKSPNDATKLGIGMVHQHFMLIDCFTGLENIILGAEPVDKIGVLHPKKVRKQIEELCEHYHFGVDLDMKVQDMPVGMQQKVEILKMLYRKTDILIFDEPTAVLTPQEIDELMMILRYGGTPFWRKWFKKKPAPTGGTEAPKAEPTTGKEDVSK